MQGVQRTPREYVSLALTRINELDIPHTRSHHACQLDLHIAKLPTALYNMEAINKAYKTQKKTPHSLPLGVPTGRGQQYLPTATRMLTPR